LAPSKFKFRIFLRPYASPLWCNEMLNHGLNHGLFISLLKLIPCPIHWIVYVLAYLNFISEFSSSFSTAKTAPSAQTHRTMSFIWIVWSTLYVYLCPVHEIWIFFGQKHSFEALWKWQ
jgi:hypothetical protein